MGESRVTAVVIGTAIAGGIAFLLLAGCTVPQIDVTADQSTILQGVPEERAPDQRPADHIPVLVDTAPGVAASAQDPVGSTSAYVEPTNPVPPIAELRPTAAETLLSPVVAPLLLGEPSGVAEVDEPLRLVGGIRSVDFRNGFSVPIPGSDPLVVVHGAAARGEPGFGDHVSLVVTDVIYGDVTGDGEDDAAVVTRSTRGAGQQQDFVTVYSVRDGVLEDWGQTWNDYSSSGGLVDVQIRNGLLKVESLDSPMRRVSSAVWATRQPGYGLVRLEPLPARDWFDGRIEPEGDAFALTEYLGARRAVLAVDRSDLAQVINFGTDAPWAMMLTPLQGNGAFVRVRSSTTGALVGDAHAGTPLDLPGPAEYVGEVLFSSDASVEAMFELEITDTRTLFAPTWEPHSVVQIDNDAHRSEPMQWPQFTSAHGAADLAVANVTIESYVVDRRERHTQELRTCADDEDTFFALSYTPTLVSYDLVSIEFDEFVRLCEGRDTARHHSLIVDLNTGAVVANDRLIANSGQLHAQWWEAARRQTYWAGDVEIDTFEPLFNEFGAIALHPFGATLTATFIGPQGDEMQLSATMSFEELDGFIDESIVTRARSGLAVPLPVSDECGC